MDREIQKIKILLQDIETSHKGKMRSKDLALDLANSENSNLEREVLSLKDSISRLTDAGIECENKADKNYTNFIISVIISCILVGYLIFTLWE